METRRLSDAEILRQIPQARAAERKARRRGHRAQSVYFDRKTARVVLELSNGVLFAFPVCGISSLRNLAPAQLDEVVLSASGSAIRWEAVDVDLSVAGLLLAAVDPAERVRHLAALAGRATSPAKAAAARANGAKGGRPRAIAADSRQRGERAKLKT